jgi:hypothetical protein
MLSRRSKNPRLSPGDEYELTEEFDIYIHNVKEDVVKIHRKDSVILAEPGDIIRFDRELARPTQHGRKIYQFTLMKDDGTRHRFDMFEPQIQKILASAVKLEK